MAKKTMEEIETLTGEFADTRAALACELDEVNQEIDAIKRRALPRIKKLVVKAKVAHETLNLAIDESREHFKKPKSRILRGIRVGLQKAKGRIDFADGDKVVELIRLHLWDKVENLIKTKETPIKDALANLTGRELKSIGVTIGDDSDKVLIKPADNEVDKLVDALLADDDPADAKAVA